MASFYYRNSSGGERYRSPARSSGGNPFRLTTFWRTAAATQAKVHGPPRAVLSDKRAQNGRSPRRRYANVVWGMEIGRPHSLRSPLVRTLALCSNRCSNHPAPGFCLRSEPLRRVVLR